MKLDHVKIQNYKSILDFECKLSEGVNVFVGHSDSGKSNVVRALRDFFFNATGDSAVTAKKTKCTIIVNDVIWNKGRGVNQYVLPTGTFENVGRTSPQELRTLFKIDEIYWDETHAKKLQFIQQHEPKFFLDDSFTGSLNAKILGLVSGIQRTYNGNRLVINDIKDAKSRRQTADTIKKQAEEDLTKYEHLPKIKHILDVIQKSIGNLKSLEATNERLKEIRNDIEDITSQLSVLENTTLTTIDMSSIQRLQKDALTISRLRKISKEGAQILEEIDIHRHASEIELNVDFSQLEETIKTCSSLRRSTNVLASIKSQYKIEQSDLSELEMELKEVDEELKGLVNGTDICPLTNCEFCAGCKDKICCI